MAKEGTYHRTDDRGVDAVDVTEACVSRGDARTRQAVMALLAAPTRVSTNG